MSRDRGRVGILEVDPALRACRWEEAGQVRFTAGQDEWDPIPADAHTRAALVLLGKPQATFIHVARSRPAPFEWTIDNLVGSMVRGVPSRAIRLIATADSRTYRVRADLNGLRYRLNMRFDAAGILQSVSDRGLDLQERSTFRMAFSFGPVHLTLPDPSSTVERSDLMAALIAASFPSDLESALHLMFRRAVRNVRVLRQRADMAVGMYKSTHPGDEVVVAPTAHGVVVDVTSLVKHASARFVIQLRRHRARVTAAAV